MNTRFVIPFAAALLIAGVASEAMAGGSSQGGSVRVATWNAAGVTDAAAAKSYVDEIGASWFGVANCGTEGVFSSFADGATVRIKFGSRTVSRSKPVLRRETPPENLSSLTFIPAAGGKLQRREEIRRTLRRISGHADYPLRANR